MCVFRCVRYQQAHSKLLRTLPALVDSIDAKLAHVWQMRTEFYNQHSRLAAQWERKHAELEPRLQSLDVKVSGQMYRSGEIASCQLTRARLFVRADRHRRGAVSRGSSDPAALQHNPQGQPQIAAACRSVRLFSPQL